MKLSKPLQDELNAKGIAQLCLEAFGLIAVIGMSYGAVLLLAFYAQTQGG